MSANPPLLICDADALIQVFAANLPAPLVCLRERFGVQPVVMPEVETELLSHRRNPTVRGQFTKAQGKGLVEVLDQAFLKQRKSSLGPQFAEQTAELLWDAIQRLGREYNVRVDLGEAYTFAAGVVLEVPAVSNDGNALKVLRNLRLRVPQPVLRSFDLYGLAVLAEYLTAQEVNKVRGRLAKAGERVPGAFANCSFEEGMAAFGLRVVDVTAAKQFDGTHPRPLELTPLASLSPHPSGPAVSAGGAADDGSD